MNIILIAVISLGAVGLVSSLALFAVSKKFAVSEDVRIGRIQEILPGANCGACGFPGCPGFASALVKADKLDDFSCPVGGQPVMDQIAEILGLEAEMLVPKTAVVHCNGNCENRPRTNQYDGSSSCLIASNLYGGTTACSYGCLGYGDCVKVCPFDAIHINPETLLAEVDDEKCTACGKCVKACPKLLIDIRKKGPKNRRIYVNCMNKDKPAIAAKSCKVACISCKKCQKSCEFEAITIANNLAVIDDDKCRLCRKCVSECPTSAIIELNFPLKKEKVVG